MQLKFQKGDWVFCEFKLQQIMEDIYNNSKEAAENYGFAGNLVMGSNIAGFVKVADAMIAHGII